MARHAADGAQDDSAPRPTWGMTWEAVADGPPPDDAGRRRRVRALIVSCVVGAVAIVVIAVVAVVGVVHGLDDRARATPAAIRADYREQLRVCIAAGRAPGTCGELAELRCRHDHRWRNTNAAEIERACRVDPAGRN